MREDIYYEYCLAMSYKTWPLKTNFDLFVLYVAQSGIQKYIELQVKTIDVLNNIKYPISVNQPEPGLAGIKRI